MPTATEQVRGIVDELVSTGRIRGDEKDNYLTLLAGDPARAEVFAGMLLRGKDYTVKSQQLAEQRREVERLKTQEQQTWAAKRQELENWQRAAQAELDEAKRLGQNVAQLSAKVAAYEQALRDYQLLESVQVPTEVNSMDYQNPNRTPVAPVQAAQPVNPTNEYLGRDEAARVLQQVVTMTGEAMVLAARHQKLFGQPLDSNLIQEALQAGEENLDRYWRTKYNVEAKESELRQQEMDAERNRIREEERAKVLQEFASNPSMASMPGGNQGRPLQIFETYNPAKAMDATTAVKAPELIPDLAAASSRVSDAVSFFRQQFDSDGNPRTGSGRTY